MHVNVRAYMHMNVTCVDAYVRPLRATPSCALHPYLHVRSLVRPHPSFARPLAPRSRLMVRLWR